MRRAWNGEENTVHIIPTTAGICICGRVGLGIYVILLYQKRGSGQLLVFIMAGTVFGSKLNLKSENRSKFVILKGNRKKLKNCRCK